jgi:hypothetical protein
MACLVHARDVIMISPREPLVAVPPGPTRSHGPLTGMQLAASPVRLSEVRLLDAAMARALRQGTPSGGGGARRGDEANSSGRGHAGISGLEEEAAAWQNAELPHEPP